MIYPSLSLSDELIAQTLFSKTDEPTKSTILNGDTLKCDKCSYKTTKKFNLYMHTKNMHQINGDIIKCDKCSYTTTIKGYMYNHNRGKHPETKIKCHKCDYSHSFTSQVRKHFKTVHLGIKRQDQKYTCKVDSCPKFGLKTCVDLEIHSKFYCGQCQFSAIRNVTMKFHIESVHEGIVYKCEQCDVVTKWERDLKVHIKAKHTRLIFECKEEGCSYSTYSGKLLEEHVEIKHEGRVKYKCEYMNCKYATNHRGTLKEHYFVHSGEKSTRWQQISFGRRI